jgi:NADH-quinone oxidoreductase subunit N
MLLSLILVLLTTVKKNNKKINEITALVWISDLNYFGKKYFYYSLFLIIIIFSMAGIPPLGGFFGKTLIFFIALQHKAFLLLSISLITSLISTFYYLNLIKIM